MGQKKKSKIILIVIILLVMLILLTGVAYTYFATDVWKSDKELFFKYIKQIGDEKEGFIEPQLKEYFEKQKNTPYTNEGTFLCNATSENGQEKEYEAINQFNISFSGVADQVNHSFEQNISLNYSDEVTFPLSYRKIKDIVGLQTKYVGTKYIAVETNKMQNQTYHEIQDIKNFIETKQKLEKSTQFLFNKEEWESIQQTYLNVINTQLQDSQFAKIEENNSKGYQLKIKGEQLKNIAIQLLETLKNDQMTLDKINQYREEQNSSKKITANTIDNEIKDIQRNSSLDDETYELTVFVERGKMTQIVLTNQETQIKLQKKKEGNSLQYTISIGEEDNMNLSFNAKYIGLETLQNITENYELNIQQPDRLTTINSNTSNNQMTAQYQFNNQINFTDTVNIEDFSEDNAMILNNYEEEQVSNFLQQVIERIQMVNKQQMEELGLVENENPLTKMLEPLFRYLQPTQAITNSIEEEEVNSFNTKFENYESTNLKGTTVKGLLSTIQQNNLVNEDNDDRKIKEIHFDGEEYETTEQNIVFIKEAIEIEESYRVEFERDENTGLIYRAVINKK